MEQDKMRNAFPEAPPPDRERIEDLADSLPASLKDLTREYKIEALNNAYNNIARTKKLIQEGMDVYPGESCAKNEKVFDEMMLGDTYAVLRRGLKTIGQLEDTVVKFRSKKDKQTGDVFIKDLHAKIFGRDESGINNYNLDQLHETNKKRINKILGTDQKASFSGQVVFRPHLSTSEYFYTNLLPFGIVMRDAITHIQQVFPKSDEESSHAAEVLKRTIIDKLPDNPTEAASTIIYKKLTTARRRT